MNIPTMMNYSGFVDALRPVFGGRVTQGQLDGVKRAIEIGYSPVALDEPPWIVEARKHIGLREIPGPRHNGFIAAGWARLNAGWFNDDETPWCGYFAAHCLDAARLPYPSKGAFARALAWLDWGIDVPSLFGAVVVFGRIGGGHVGFAVGQSATHIYVLGGNQNNMVSIMPLEKERLRGFRWPKGVDLPTTRLPAMSGGVVSTNEA